MADCNHCSLQRIRDDARETKQKVTLGYSHGGTDVYVHPREVNINKLNAQEKEKYHRAWLMEVPDHCCC